MIYIGALVLALVLWPYVRRFVMLGVLRASVGAVAKDISDRSLANVPDTIHLSRRTYEDWKNRAAADAFATPLLGTGFEDAGTFVIPEMPGVLCRLMAEPRESIGAVVYEHPKVGVWLELVSRYTDGTTVSCSTLKPSGIAPRPGHTSVHVPGATATGLVERMRAERPLKSVQALTAATFPRTFEIGYAESIAYRKQKGVSAAEIVEVAKQRQAA
jgi:hypothetical protein